MSKILEVPLVVEHFCFNYVNYHTSSMNLLYGAGLGRAGSPQMAARRGPSFCAVIFYNLGPCYKSQVHPCLLSWLI